MVAIHMRPLCVLTIFRISLLMMTPNCVGMAVDIDAVFGSYPQLLV